MTDRELLELIAAQVGILTKDVSEIKEDISELKEDGSELKEDVSELKGDVSGLKGDVSGLKGDVSGLINDVSELKEGQKDIKKHIISIIDQTAGLSEFRYEINEKVDKLTEEFSTMEIVTSKNWNDIARLKAAR